MKNENVALNTEFWLNTKLIDVFQNKTIFVRLLNDV